MCLTAFASRRAGQHIAVSAAIGDTSHPVTTPVIAAAVMASSNVPIEQPVGRLSTRRTLLIRPSLASYSLSRNGVLSPSLVLSVGELRFMSAVREPVVGDLIGTAGCETVIGV